MPVSRRLKSLPEGSWTDGDWYELSQYLDRDFAQTTEASICSAKPLVGRGDLWTKAYLFARDPQYPGGLRPFPATGDTLQIVVRNVYHFVSSYAAHVTPAPPWVRLRGADGDGSWRTAESLRIRKYDVATPVPPMHRKTTELDIDEQLLPKPHSLRDDRPPDISAAFIGYTAEPGSKPREGAATLEVKWRQPRGGTSRRQ